MGMRMATRAARTSLRSVFMNDLCQEKAIAVGRAAARRAAVSHRPWIGVKRGAGIFDVHGPAARADGLRRRSEDPKTRRRIRRREMCAGPNAGLRPASRG